MRKMVIEDIELQKRLTSDYEQNSVDVVVKACEMIIDSLSNGGCVYLCGNGGSAADCQHIAGEFVGRFLKNRKALPAVALTADQTILTAVGNDFSYDDVFGRSVSALCKKNDVLWAFSTSGKSANILKAAKVAKNKGVKVLAFTGKAESPLEEMSDVCLVAEAPSSYGAQQIHQLAYHTICRIVEEKLCP